MTSIQQREQLQSQIWKIANEVRGAVDGWDFKQFVLGTLFYRFISENFTDYIEGSFFNCSANHLPVFFFSTKTNLSLFISPISIIKLNLKQR